MIPWEHCLAAGPQPLVGIIHGQWCRCAIEAYQISDDDNPIKCVRTGCNARLTLTPAQLVFSYEYDALPPEIEEMGWDGECNEDGDFIILCPEHKVEGGSIC